MKNGEIDADSFLRLLEANVNNSKLSDKKFRDLVRSSLPEVDYLTIEEKKKEDES